jgi:hypothetical protein
MFLRPCSVLKSADNPRLYPGPFLLFGEPELARGCGEAKHRGPVFPNRAHSNNQLFQGERVLHRVTGLIVIEINVNGA